MRPSDDLARIASRYEYTTAEVALPNVGEWVQLLPADPYRWQIVFSGGVGAFDQLWVLPGGPSAGSYGLTIGFAPLSFNFRDSPAMVIDSWWAMSGANIPIRYVSTRFLG